LLYVAAEVGIWNWLALYLTGKGLPQAQALRVLSFGFAAGIVTGRLTASRIPARFHASGITLACSVLMALLTSALLLTSGALSAGVAVFCAGMFMGSCLSHHPRAGQPGFPARHCNSDRHCGHHGLDRRRPQFQNHRQPRGDSPHGLGTALLVIPALSVLMWFGESGFSALAAAINVPAQP